MNRLKKTAIHQFHANVAYGDAVTSYMVSLQKIFQELGFGSNIYSIFPPKGFFHPVEDWRRGCFDPLDILLIHHSSCNPHLHGILKLPCKKVGLFQNITPTKYFENPGHVKLVEIGFDQIPVLGRDIQFWLSTSQTNTKVLKKHGQDNIFNIPIVVPFVDDVFSRQNVSEKPSKKTLLFVGRVVPNKNQEELILLMKHYVDNFGSDDIQLILVGNDQVFDGYAQYCKKLINLLGLSEIVRFLGTISEAALRSWYQCCDLFICMSEHEGIGLPLIEAMVYQKPILAFAEEGVVETVRDAGLLFDKKEPDRIILLIREILYGGVSLDDMHKAQSRRLKEFSHANCKAWVETHFLPRIGYEY